MKGPNDSEVTVRTLIYIHVIHTQADMGALGEAVKQATLKKSGREGWKRKVNLVDTMWTEIEQTIDSFNLPYDRVRIYQDGLPVCGREAEIVMDLAKAGSRNHGLLHRLTKNGATIMGTESLELLIEEYELAKQIFAAERYWTGGNKALSDSLLMKRDQFIANRINSTLREGEKGILFLGILHSVEKWLDRDIRVICPIHQPVRRERG